MTEPKENEAGAKVNEFLPYSPGIPPLVAAFCAALVAIYPDPNILIPLSEVSLPGERYRQAAPSIVLVLQFIHSVAISTSPGKIREPWKWRAFIFVPSLLLLWSALVPLWPWLTPPPSPLGWWPLGFTLLTVVHGASMAFPWRRGIVPRSPWIIAFLSLLSGLTIGSATPLMVPGREICFGAKGEQVFLPYSGGTLALKDVNQAGNFFFTSNRWEGDRILRCPWGVLKANNSGLPYDLVVTSCSVPTGRICLISVKTNSEGREDDS